MSHGTTVVTSGREISESAVEIAARPDANGFYKWTDRLVKDNGKEDCAGDVTPTGKVVVNYVLFNPAHDQLIVCTKASLDACFGPLRRAPGTGVYAGMTSRLLATATSLPSRSNKVALVVVVPLSIPSK